MLMKKVKYTEVSYDEALKLLPIESHDDFQALCGMLIDLIEEESKGALNLKFIKKG